MNRHLSLLAVAACALTLGGCDKKEAPQQAAPAPVATRPADPMDGIELHPKVRWAADKYAPISPEQAQAIASLANALASGDADKAKSVLEAADQAVLADLIAFGEWADQTKGIEEVRVCVLSQNEDKTVSLGLGVQDALGAYMVAWKGADAGSAWVFSGMAIEPVTAASTAMLEGAELKAPVIAGAAVETQIVAAKNPAAADKKEGGGSTPGGSTPGDDEKEAPSNRPFSKPPPQ